jgi:hypothetical protein
MRRLALRLVPLLLAISAAACWDFQKDAPVSPSAVPPGRYVSVKILYRQPAVCANDPVACDNLVVFFGSWMKPGEEIYLEEVPGSRTWAGVASGVPVNWPPVDSPHLVRVFDPHLVQTQTGGVTAARLTIGGQIIYSFDQPGTPQESGLIYVDDNGVGRN